jgi:hypothetical protein
MVLVGGGRPRWLTVFLLGFASWLTIAAFPSVNLTVTTGQQLADAVAAFGASGQDTLVTLDPPFSQNDTQLISVSHAKFATLEQIAAASPLSRTPFSSGNIVVGARLEAPGVVLDAGMRHDLTPQFQAVTTLALRNFTMARGLWLLRSGSKKCVLWKAGLISVRWVGYGIAPSIRCSLAFGVAPHATIFMHFCSTQKLNKSHVQSTTTKL